MHQKLLVQDSKFNTIKELWLYRKKLQYTKEELEKIVKKFSGQRWCWLVEYKYTVIEQVEIDKRNEPYQQYYREQFK